jgi:endonuclease-3
VKPQAVVTRIFDALDRHHPNADTELVHRNAFELLVATILSAQSTDARVNIVSPALFERYPDAASLAAAKTPELEKMILSTGFFRQKSKSLIGMATMLVDEHRGQGARRHGGADEAAGRRQKDGQTSCSVMRSASLDCRSIGTCCASPTGSALVKNDDPVKVEAQLCAMLPPDRWTRASDTLILHGRRICKPKPLCPRCNVRPDCDFLSHRLHDQAHQAWWSLESREVPCQARGKEDGEEGREEVTKELSRARRGSDRHHSLRFARQVRNVAIVIEDEPSDDCSTRMESKTAARCWASTTARRSLSAAGATAISCPIASRCFSLPSRTTATDEDEIFVAIGETLIHELGHYFGMSEEEIDVIEDDTGAGDPNSTKTAAMTSA